MKRQILTIIVCLLTLSGFAGTAYVVDANSLNVRKAPSTDAAVIGKVTKGQEINVLNIKNGWACISFQKGEGYVSAQYISKKSGKTQTSNTSSNTASQSKSTGSTSKSSQSSSSKTFPYSDGLGPRYGGWTETGVLFNNRGAGFNLDLVNGCYIRDYIFVGGGIGLHGMFSPAGVLLSIPIYAQARGLLRINRIVAPILDFSIGGYAGFASDWENRATGGGFYMRVAPGIKLGKHFHMNIGYERCGMNTGVFTIGADW